MQHTASTAAHGRRESRSIKSCAIADNLGGINFPLARLTLRLHLHTCTCTCTCTATDDPPASERLVRPSTP
ncbi:hypothetical protein [Streptomyces sp. NBC_00576]|uniref:hypothetical protein n=1 Tax=Streptomyces sp. NBC_00576 TaxID=2903665 RepID=UPI002E8172B9|nr:hypothetical protein [Streptomyces sp. NBC_00576]WUB68930.1 hypothetical protein OG734_01845 [Streptomyces sp. NBC_00576]